LISTFDEKLIGLEVGASDFLTKNSDDRELLIRVKNLLRAKQNIDIMMKLSLYDGLTEIYNRRYFQQRLQEECTLCNRYKRSFSCALLDIDHLKHQ